MTREALATLHALCFKDTPRPWSPAEFEEILGTPGTFLVSQPRGFAVGRATGQEAELLTLAVHPSVRRLGVGTTLVEKFEARSLVADSSVAYLEVAETNASARGLYTSMGYELAGRRPKYYHTARGNSIDALVLRKRLLVA